VRYAEKNGSQEGVIIRFNSSFERTLRPEQPGRETKKNTRGIRLTVETKFRSGFAREKELISKSSEHGRTRSSTQAGEYIGKLLGGDGSENLVKEVYRAKER